MSKSRVLIMMEGVAGSGKSTLAEGLAQRLGERGQRVDLVPEEAIFNRPEFEEVGHAFKHHPPPDTEMMLEAYKQVFDAARSNDITVVSDWSALGMIEDLPCAQPDRTSLTSDDPNASADQEVLIQHASDVRNLWNGTAVLLLLKADVLEATRRAMAERGQEWVDRYVELSKTYEGTPEERIAARGKSFGPRVDAIIEAFKTAGWRVVELDASRASEAVLESAVEAITKTVLSDHMSR